MYLTIIPDALSAVRDQIVTPMRIRIAIFIPKSTTTIVANQTATSSAARWLSNSDLVFFDIPSTSENLFNS